MKFLSRITAVVFASLSISSAYAQSTKITPLGNVYAPDKGTFYVVLQSEPPTLNPLTMADLYGFRVRGYVSDTLGSRNIDTYEFEPALAESWEISKDGMQYVFKIRQGAKFHDGKPVTADDIKFSFDVIFDPAYNAAPLRPYYESIEKAEVVDPQTVRFTAKKKYFKNFEVLAGLTILPKHIYGDSKKGSKLNKTIMGSGPYKLEKWEQGQRITLVKNKDWWGNSVPELKGAFNFEKIVFRIIKEENVAMETLKKGQVDYNWPITPEAFAQKAVGPQFGKTAFKSQVQNKYPKSYGYIGWNNENSLFKDRNVRVALAHLMNRQLMIDKFRFGMSLPATGPWYQQSDYADPAVKAIPFDPKKAGELLLKAGWTDSDKDGVLDKTVDGKKVKFSFTLANASKDAEKYLTIYKEDLRKAGIDMNIKLLEWNAFSKLVDEMNFDAVAMAWGAGSVDIDPKQIWHSSSATKGGSNFISYKNPEVDKLLDQGQLELDKKKRIEIYRKVYRLIAEDAPYAFLFNNKFELYVHSSKVKKPKDTFAFDIGPDFWWAAE